MTKRSKLIHPMIPGTAWPSGDYYDLATLDISEAEIVDCIGAELISGEEAGLGRWRAIAGVLASGIVMELVVYPDQPMRGFGLCVDSATEADAALRETLEAFGIDERAVLWRSPRVTA